MIGYFDDRWTLRQAIRAVEAKRRDDWERLGWGLLWIVNRMPNFGKQRRPPVKLHQLNPFAKPLPRGKSQASKDAAFNALWDQAEDA